MRQERIAVIGAGIAGLTAAIAFARHGHDVTVIERADELSALGAGLQLSPNATRIMQRLDLLAAVEARWQETESVSLVSGTSLRRIADVPAGAFARRRWGAPYGVLRRADLQSILVDAATALPGCRIRLGGVIDATEVATIKRQVADVVGAEPALIVGADGVHSAVRSLVRRSGRARFSGYTAWRALIAPGEGLELVPPARTTAFMGPASHLVAYRLPDAVNLVAVVPGNGETAGASAADLEQAFARWNPAVRRLLRASRDITAWPLYEVGDGPWLAEDGIVLIGDAAHAMMPFAAQGAALAIEDGFELAETFSKQGIAGLPGFVERRRRRVERVRRRTDFNRVAYHARGPLRLGRDLLLKSRSGESLAGDLDWLYGYRSPDLG